MRDKTEKVASVPKTPNHCQLMRAHEILEYGIESVNNLYVLHHGREREDWLKGMLVMAGATFDDTINELEEALSLRIEQGGEESMFSIEKANRFAEMLGIDLRSKKRLSLRKLKKAFDVRNRIISELYNFSEKKSWMRCRRRKDRMREYAAAMIDLTKMLLDNADSRLDRIAISG